MKNYRVKLQHNIIQENPYMLSSLQGSLTLSYTESSKGCIKINIKFGRNSDVKKVLVKLQHGTCNFEGCFALTRSFELGLHWKYKKVTIKIGWNSDEKNITNCKVKTWCRQVLGHYHTHNELQIILPFDCDLVQNVKQVRQRSTSNSSKILIWRISL